MGLLPSGETKDCDDQQSDNTVPCEDTFDEFMDLEVDSETQPMNFDDETQLLDLAGETQVMDDYDFDDHANTQQINVSDTQDCEGTMSDDEGSQVTQPLDGNDSPCTALEEKGTRSMHSDNVSESSASLQAAGLGACQTALKIADDRSHGTVLSNLSSDLHPLDNLGFIEISEKVGAENEMTKCNEEGLTDGERSDVARSLARRLFTEEHAIEMESDIDVSDRSKDLSQFPSCDDNLAGLSYVDSQEPGELSQVNALEFVDKFLKFNMFESDQGVLSKTGAGETGIPGSISKGAQSIAQKASRRSTLAEPSIYEWDDNLEDEGGGAFFTKKKEVLLGHNSCPRPRSSQHREPRVSRSAGKLRNKKEKQVVHDTTMGFLHSDLKPLNGGQKGKAKRIVVEENDCSHQHLEALPNVLSVDMQNVGIDTQMAAEAIEALSAGSALMNNGNCVVEQDRETENTRFETEALKDGPKKKNSHQKRTFFFTSGVVTRSRSKGKIMKYGQETKCHSTPSTRRRSIMGKLDVSPVKPNKKQKRSSVVANRMEKLDTVAMSVGDKQKESVLEEQLNIDPPRQLRRSLRGKSSVLALAAEEVMHCVESPHDTFTFGHHSMVVEAVQETRSKKRKCVVSENCNTRKEDMEITSTTENDMVDGSHYKTVECIPRWTRSKRNSFKGTECLRDKKGLLSSRLLSSEDACQLSSKKQDASTPPAKGNLASTTVDVTPENMKKSSKSPNVTPVHLKTSTSAVSPICIGDGYQTPSCKRRASLEFISLCSSEISSSPSKGLRQRRDKNTIRVLFSQHLDGDIVRHQKKNLYRLGVSEASTILEATHFVADSFLRTRNMLEAIASGKPVVTPFWLESCGQANCIIDEKNYILRDAAKEKELGFSMPKSLAHASRYPLLEGKRVLITPNVKPGKEVILSLVKAVRGQAVERLGRSLSNNDKLLTDLLVLSCEEDLGVSEPFLEKGIAVYSSELLLNGIITQRLEYERYRLFVSHVKKTRSTLWLKKGEQIFPVTKLK